MPEYTPTTDEVMSNFVAPSFEFNPIGPDETFASYMSRVSMETFQSQQRSEASARRWLAQHDREVAARALREAVEDLPNVSWAPVGTWLRDRADRIEKGDNDD